MCHFTEAADHGRLFHLFVSLDVESPQIACSLNHAVNHMMSVLEFKRAPWSARDDYGQRV
jgi:hypothetical protein